MKHYELDTLREQRLTLHISKFEEKVEQVIKNIENDMINMQPSGIFIVLKISLKKDCDKGIIRIFRDYPQAADLIKKYESYPDFYSVSVFWVDMNNFIVTRMLYLNTEFPTSFPYFRVTSDSTNIEDKETKSTINGFVGYLDYEIYLHDEKDECS